MRSLLAVFAGGLVGTLLRLLIDLAVPHGDDDFPVSTLLINLVGAFALGLLTAWLWPRASASLKALLGPGLLGSFTTFSAVAVSLVALADAGEWVVGVVYLVATVALGLGAAWGGLRVGSIAGSPDWKTTSKRQPSGPISTFSARTWAWGFTP